MPPAGLPSHLVCGGCGLVVAPDRLPPFACPAARAGDDVDHVLGVRLEPGVPFPQGDEPDPFVAFRTLAHAYHLARAGGLADDAYVVMVRELEGRIAAVDGHGFARTPYAEAPALARAAGWPGELWVKDETGNVSGSHKARHMMGLALFLEVAQRLGAHGADRPLALSSCGNAALGAAVVARAAGRHLEVFVPTWADPVVLARLAALGATVVPCPRAPGQVGDPCTARLRAAVTAGAIPFSCQGPDNGLVIEGGMTLGWELLAAAAPPPDRLFVQVGGGALASAMIQAVAEGVARGVWPRLPALHVVQTEGAAPLRRAYLAVLGRLLPDEPTLAPGAPAPGLPALARLAARAAERPDAHEAALAWAASHRAACMWPWEEEPRSLAHGILDDETYDWLAIVRGLLASGGYPIVVGEPLVEEAHRLGRAHTAIPVDPTGTSGLAGLLAVTRAGLAHAGERAAVLFTGRERTGGRQERSGQS